MKTNRLLPSLCLALATLLALPGSADGAPPTAGTSADTPLVAGDDLASRLAASMSLEDKVSQLIMSYPPLDPTAPVTVGSVIFVGKLLRSAEGIRTKAADLQKRARIPLLIAVDMEGGKFNRLKSVKSLRGTPSGRDLGQRSEAEVRAWGRKVGKEMRALGLNCNLSPVLDLADRGMMFDSERSMGADPERVGRLGRAYARGLWAEGVVPIGKHFPGYGPLEENSDHALVITDREEAEIATHAGVFTRAGDSLAGVMLANVGYTAYDAVPAILSPKLVGLAHEQGWVTITDDLAVATLSEATGGDQEEVVRRAFLAGNDILLTTAPIDWDKGLDYRRIVLDLVKARPELEARVDRSVLRILRLKERAGLLEPLRAPLLQAKGETASVAPNRAAVKAPVKTPTQAAAATAVQAPVQTTVQSPVQVPAEATARD